jgi:hypothetical protein
MTFLSIFFPDHADNLFLKKLKCCMKNKKHTYQKPAEAGTLLLTADATQAGHLIKLGTTTTPPK